MHIVHVTEALGGGVGELLVLVTRACVGQGLRTTVVYAERPELANGWGDRFDGRVDLIRSPVPLRPRASFPRDLRRLRAFLGSLDADLVHLHSSYAGFVGRLACRHDIETAYTPSGFAFLREDIPLVARALTWLGERAAGRYGTVIACSSSEARLATRVAARVRTVPNGIADHPLFTAETTPGEDDLVVGCGRLAPQKDPLAFVRIAADVAATLGRPLRARWIGEGPLHAQALELARRLGVDLTITGWRAREEGIELLSTAGVVLYPARWDGLPLTLLEAAALGRAIVARDTPAARDATGGPAHRLAGREAARAAYLVRDEAEAASRTAALLEQPDERMRIGRAARERWRERFTEDRFAGRLSDAYEALTGSARMRSAVEKTVALK